MEENEKKKKSNRQRTQSQYHLSSLKVRGSVLTVLANQV